MFSSLASSGALSREFFVNKFMNNRIIKFRVWDTKKLIYTDEPHRIMNDRGGHPYLPFYLHQFVFDNRNVVIQQFTGLKDKNGREIFEGDIIEVAKNKIYQVKFIEGGESNYEWYGGCFVLWMNDEIFFPFDEYAMKNGVVIGNIFDNPEMIK